MGKTPKAKGKSSKSEDAEEKEDDIDWHLAFFQAIQLELARYHNDLEYLYSQKLTQKPLEIDVVIIKKKKDVVIDNPLGKIFRGHNIVEFKSYQASLSVDAFYKVIAYTYFYKSLDTTVDIRDVTITFIVKMRPKKLFKHLENEQGFTIAEDESGIHTVSGYHLPVQIIETQKLSEENSVYLSGLSRNLGADKLKSIIEAVSEERNAKSDAYLQLILQANIAALEEVRAMGAKKLDEYLEEVGFTEMWIARGEERERAKWQKQLQEERAKWQTEVQELRSQVAELKAKHSNN